jgi:uncharacterized protein (DUF427 family)
MFIPGTNSIKDTGYTVDNSCRFNGPDSAYMSKTPASFVNATKFTFSAWVKRSGVIGASSDNEILFSNWTSTNASSYIRFEDADDNLQFFDKAHASNLYNYKTVMKFRDTSAFYHIVVAGDTSEDAGNRIKFYVNGTEVARTATTDQTQDFAMQSAAGTDSMIVGAVDNTGGVDTFFNGYMCEVYYIDGADLTASDFGEFDSDSPTIWKPKAFSGSFGTNGFYLDFEDSANLGNDANGGTDLTEVNLAATDQATDTPTNNFATLNPLLYHTYAGTYSEGNLKMVASNDSWYADGSTIAPTNGKWYMEVKITAIGNFCALGVGTFPFSNVGHSQLIGELANTIGWRNNGVLNQNGSAGTSLNSYTTNDIIGMYLDLDNGKFYFAKNGTLESGTGLSLTTGIEYFFVTNPRGSTLEHNFGNPTWSLSSAVADANSYGSFEYDPSAGTFDGASKVFYALNTKNLAEFG